MDGHFPASIHFEKWLHPNSIDLILVRYHLIFLRHQAGIYHVQHEVTVVKTGGMARLQGLAG